MSSDVGKLLAAAGWLVGGQALGLPVSELLSNGSEATRQKEELAQLRVQLDEERRKRRVAEQAHLHLRERIVHELRSTPEGILGLLPEADLEVATAAYRVMAKRHHPDHGGSAGRMRQLNWAIEQVRARGKK